MPENCKITEMEIYTASEIKYTNTILYCIKHVI